MLTVRHFALSAAVVMLLAGASYARGASAAESSAVHLRHPGRPEAPEHRLREHASVRDSVLKSTDAGKTWSVADTGLTNPTSPTDSEDLRVDALALDPRSPNVLYAGTGLGVFKTNDGAQTWKLASTGIDLGGGLAHRMYEGSIYAIAIDPLHTSTVYAAGRDIWKSTNGGATWKRVHRHGAISLGIDPRRPETVYAGATRRSSRQSTVEAAGARLVRAASGTASSATRSWSLDGRRGRSTRVDREVSSRARTRVARGRSRCQAE